MADSSQFAGYWDRSETATLYDTAPLFQLIAADCPCCGCVLHYSSGWDRRTCETCGYIEGFRGQQYYPDALSMDEWMFTVGQWYMAVCNRELASGEYRTLVYAITFKGSPYRPPGEVTP